MKFRNFRGQQQSSEKLLEVKTESVKDYMATKLICYHPEQGIYEVIDSMLKHKISGAPVLDDAGTLVGIISEQDCLKEVIDVSYHNLPTSEAKVKNYMTKDVQTIDASKDVLEVAQAFLNSNYRRFPVIENGRLVGQVSRRDILRAAQNMKSATW
jgi:predicted transcriptional regulator